jgi:hypothetical protein
MCDIVFADDVGVLLLKFLLTFLGSERIHQHLFLLLVIQMGVEDVRFFLEFRGFGRRFQLEIVGHFEEFDLT